MGNKLTAAEIIRVSKNSVNQGFDICSKCDGVEIANTMSQVDPNGEDFDLICDECTLGGMHQLGARNYSLISRGVKSEGSYNPDEIMYAFEEELYVDEYDEIHSFLQWCHDNGKGFGHGNYEERFQEFKQATK